MVVVAVDLQDGVAVTVGLVDLRNSRHSRAGVTTTTTSGVKVRDRQPISKHLAPGKQLLVGIELSSS